MVLTHQKSIVRPHPHVYITVHKSNCNFNNSVTKQHWGLKNISLYQPLKKIKFRYQQMEHFGLLEVTLAPAYAGYATKFHKQSLKFG